MVSTCTWGLVTLVRVEFQYLLSTYIYGGGGSSFARGFGGFQCKLNVGLHVYTHGVTNP